MTHLKHPTLLAAAVLSAFTWASTAGASILVGFSTSNTTPTAGNQAAFFNNNTTLLPGWTITASGSSAGNGNLLGNTIDVSASTAGTIFIFVTETGNTSTGPINFASSFDNVAGSTLSYTGLSFESPTNTAFAETNPLSSATQAPGTASGNLNDLVNSPGSPYSITEVFQITAPVGGGNVNASIDVTGTAVPEPASLMILGSALAGLGLIRRRRKSA